MRIVPINLIPDGSQLAKTLYSSDGRVLLRAGITLDGSKLSRASQMGFKSLYINDGFSTNTIDDLIDPQTRVRSVKQVKESYDAFENYAQESNKGQSNQWKLSEMRYEYLSGVKNTAQDIVDVLLNKKKHYNQYSRCQANGRVPISAHSQCGRLICSFRHGPRSYRRRP